MGFRSAIPQRLNPTGCLEGGWPYREGGPGTTGNRETVLIPQHGAYVNKERQVIGGTRVIGALTRNATATDHGSTGRKLLLLPPGRRWKKLARVILHTPSVMGLDK